jgi:DNA-binding PadR family transcriptional regulator
LPVWEDAVDGGLVVRRREGAGEAMVSLTAKGRDWLVRAGRAAA